MAEKKYNPSQGADKEWGVGSPDCRTWTYSCASMFHAVMGSAISHMGYRESSRKEESHHDHRTQDDNGNDGRRKKERLQPRGAPHTHTGAHHLCAFLSPCLPSPPFLHLERPYPIPVSFSALRTPLGRMFPGASAVLVPCGSPARRGAPGELHPASFPPVESCAPLVPGTCPHLVGANCTFVQVS